MVRTPPPPFIGVGRAGIGAGILLAGFTLFTKTKDVITSPEGRSALHFVQDRICTMYGMLETTWIKKGFPVAILTLLLITPLTTNNYYIDVLTITGIYAILALGLNIVVGLAGSLDLGFG